MTVGNNIGAVVIGRNEGVRLQRCLQNIKKEVHFIVYVDSGSTDESINYAISNGVNVVNLDMTIPFSAARARNEGFSWLSNKYPNLEYIQFIDGDCELSSGWLPFAFNYLENNTVCAIATGRRKEKFPEKSVYNLLCDIEWDTPIGKVNSCGGDFMISTVAFQSVNGFNPQIIAGEEPELCYRLRQKGWEIHRLDYLMTHHDADITSFSQWWKRVVRGGYSYAMGYALHGKSNEKFRLKDCIRIWLWALVFPFFILSTCFFYNKNFYFLLAVYILQLLKIAIQINKRIATWKLSIVYAIFNILGKWAQLYGQFTYIKQKLSGTESTIIEYK